MTLLIRKIGELASAIEHERGEFVLFALVLPEDTIAWDLLVAADWIDKDKKAAQHYLVEKIQTILTKQELRDISGVLLFDSDRFKDYSTSISSTTGWEEKDVDLYGRRMQKAYLFAAPVEDFQLSVNR